MKIKVKRIVLDRAEGLSSECGPQPPVTSFSEANLQLKQMATSAPKGGGYDKTDFEIEYEDGHKYQGRYDLTRDDMFNASLERHIIDFNLCYSGRKRPEHISAEAFTRFLQRIGQDAQDECGKFLDNYQVGD